MKNSREVSGHILVTDNNYSHIEKAINILKGYNFELDYVKTGGESSSHEWTCGFDKKYATMKEFHENAADDFMTERKMNNEDGGPSLVWQYTIFSLTNKDKHTQIQIFTKEIWFEETDESQYSSYYFLGSEDMDDYDDTLAEEIKEKLDTIK